jgi:hypothetical protein
MSILGYGLLAAAKLRAAHRAHRARNPRASQERALFTLLNKARNTAFGEHFRFDAIQSVADYQHRVPLHRYEDLRPWFQRAVAGERDVAWPGKIRYFGMTSGTTAGNKYLPVSRDSIAQQKRGGFEAMASYLDWTNDTSILDGQGMMLGGSSDLDLWQGGALVGDNTGIMARHMPRVLSSKYLPSERVRKMREWDPKLRAIAIESLHADVRLIGGTPSWFPALFDQVIALARSRGYKVDTLCEVWPNFRLMMGGGVRYDVYKPLIDSRLGRPVPYVETYNATEGGIMGVQDHLSEPQMLLLPDNGVFYEFVPLEDAQASKPRRVPLWEVELNVPYVLLVSTMSGIWSYAIGDILRFVERFPHRFLFEGRVQAFLNLQGEHVSQGELERAVHSAGEQLAVRPVDFTVAADVRVEGSQAARHVLFVEFDGVSPEPQTFAALFDRNIASANDDYCTHRASSHGLVEPVMRPLPRGTFEEWMRRRGKLGGQNKVPRVVLDRDQRQLLEQVACERQAAVG